MEQIPTIKFTFEEIEGEDIVSDELQHMEFVQNIGNCQTQVITLSSKMIDLNFEFTSDARIYLTIEEKNINLQSDRSIIKILWINASQTFDSAKIDFKSYVHSKLLSEDPEILIVSSSSMVYPGWLAARDINNSGTWKANHFGPVGMDGSGFCVATKGGVIAGRGNAINSDMVFTYANSM